MFYNTVVLIMHVSLLSVRLSVCLSVCLSVRSHNSKTTQPNFTKFSAHVAFGRGSVLLRVTYVLPVFWMTSCFMHIMAA